MAPQCRVRPTAAQWLTVAAAARVGAAETGRSAPRPYLGESMTTKMPAQRLSGSET